MAAALTQNQRTGATFVSSSRSMFCTAVPTSSYCSALHAYLQSFWALVKSSGVRWTPPGGEEEGEGEGEGEEEEGEGEEDEGEGESDASCRGSDGPSPGLKPIPGPAPGPRPGSWSSKDPERGPPLKDAPWENPPAPYSSTRDTRDGRLENTFRPAVRSGPLQTSWRPLHPGDHSTLETTTPWRPLHPGDHYTLETTPPWGPLHPGDHYTLETTPPWRPLHPGDHYTLETTPPRWDYDYWGKAVTTDRSSTFRISVQVLDQSSDPADLRWVFKILHHDITSR
ncbi:hypothetical protein EYF80_057475 [Liparis tanakae]|uniref:Uncharacterized protein n=1 Tax=Liparis tanakae TaxID=230148 RepID=A0A4Z2ETY0_9TELE|nr:hypothetical protein EYF80_057475 [Liparis tanakae]